MFSLVWAEPTSATLLSNTSLNLRHTTIKRWNRTYKKASNLISTHSVYMIGLFTCALLATQLEVQLLLFVSATWDARSPCGPGTHPVSVSARKSKHRHHKGIWIYSDAQCCQRLHSSPPLLNSWLFPQPTANFYYTHSVWWFKKNKNKNSCYITSLSGFRFNTHHQVVAAVCFSYPPPVRLSSYPAQLPCHRKCVEAHKPGAAPAGDAAEWMRPKVATPSLRHI